MVVRFYSSTAQVSALTGSITNASTTITLTTVSGWPTSTPFTAVIDPDTPSAEVVNVSATAGTTYTIQRGIDGTSAASHNASAVVRHMASARDFADSRAHENAVANVHGVGGSASLVGTTTTQTLTNKTLTSPVINGATFDNINVGAWTAFTPTLQTLGGNITGSPVFNSGRYAKVGRTVHLHMEVQGNSGMTIPGGDGSSVVWNVPAGIAPRNPSGADVVITAGGASMYIIFAIEFGDMYYQNGFPGFQVRRSGGSSTLDGSDLKSGMVISLDGTYETN